MARTLYQVLNWADNEGPVKARARIKMSMLSDSIAAKVNLSKVDETTKAPPDYLEKLIKVASDIVGKPCPRIL